MTINQIPASDVDQRIISSQNFQNWTLWIKKFTGAQKHTKTRSFRLTKIDKTLEKVQTKTSHRKNTHPWQVCLKILKTLEYILETARN